MRDPRFRFEAPCVFFEKASAPPGRRRRIAGIISTESRDRQQEIVIQKGLDFEPFVNHGWFNDNHSKATDGIVGHPENVKYFRKGERLPNGEKAPVNLTWSEGYMIEGHPRADSIWQLGTALQKSPGNRRLGFSIEGNVERRMGPGRKIIAKAKVKNVAITNCPVNTDTRLETLAKSLIAISQDNGNEEEYLKALTMSPAVGTGAGAVITPQSLEMDEQLKILHDQPKKNLSKAEAIEWLAERLPNASTATLGRIVDTTLLLKRSGKL